MSAFQFQMVEQPTALVLKLTGALSVAEAEEFERQFPALVRNRHKRIILDLTDLALLTSAGIGSMIRLQRQMLDAGGDVRLAGVQPAIADVLRKARLDQVFGLFGTVAEAAN
jgi:anti-anti-sigma factor